MIHYTLNEIADMIWVLRECRGNYKAAARLCREKFPDRRQPNNVAIRRCEIRARWGYLQRYQNRQCSQVSEIARIASNGSSYICIANCEENEIIATHRKKKHKKEEEKETPQDKDSEKHSNRQIDLIRADILVIFYTLESLYKKFYVTKIHD